MANLTTPQTNYIRLMSGDNATGDFVVDATLLQAMWDDNEFSLCATIVSVLEARLANATTVSGVDENSAQVVANPQVNDIKQTLDYWREKCAASNASVTVSRLRLGLDEEIQAT